MKYRRLRIAWSVGWGMAAVLMIALWVRSYWIWDRCYWPGLPRTQLGTQLSSDSGHTVTVISPRVATSSGSLITISRPGPAPTAYQALYSKETFGFYFTRTPTLFRFDLPYWSPVTASLALGLAPWLIRPRFSLRTLLVATTLAAVGLGLIVWLAR